MVSFITFLKHNFTFNLQIPSTFVTIQSKLMHEFKQFTSKNKFTSKTKFTTKSKFTLNNHSIPTHYYASTLTSD